MEFNDNERPASGIYSARAGRIKGQESDNSPAVSLTLTDGDIWYADSFGFTDADLFLMELKGNFAGNVILSHDEKQKEIIGEYDVDTRNDYWEIHLVPIVPTAGRHPLYMHVTGKGSMELRNIGFISA